MSIKHEKKLVNRFLQDAASAGIRSLQITIEIKLCQTKSMERTLERKRNYAAVLRERLLAIKHTLLFVSRKISCRHDITNFDRTVDEDFDPIITHCSLRGFTPKKWLPGTDVPLGWIAIFQLWYRDGFLMDFGRVSRHNRIVQSHHEHKA